MTGFPDRSRLSPPPEPPSIDASHESLHAVPRPADAVIARWEGVRELHPAVLASRLGAGDFITVIDVRERWEWETARVEGARLIPLGEFIRESSSLNRLDEIVVYCHHGVRSLAAATYLAEQGFLRLWNLAGGIDRYALEGDSTIPRY